MQYGSIGQQGAAMAAAGYASNAKAEGEVCRPEIQQQFDRMERSLDYVEDAIGQLAQRLGCVMRPPAPESAAAQGIGLAPPSTPYGAHLHEFVSRADSIGERVLDLLNRLEV